MIKCMLPGTCKCYYQMGYIYRSTPAFHMQTSLSWRPCLEMEVHKVELSLYMKIAIFHSKDKYACQAEVRKALVDSAL
jgi:hypothetical protein